MKTMTQTTILTACLAAALAVPEARAVWARLSCSGSRAVSRSRSVMPITPLRGVRSSWLITARKRLLAWLASSERARASSSSSL